MTADDYSPLCPVCGDPYIGGPGCRAGACAADPEEPVSAADEFGQPFPATTEINVASVNSAADILRAFIARESPDLVPLLFNADYEGMAMALDEAGRLLPSDAPTWTEYGTQRAGGGVFAAPDLDMALADEAHSRQHRYGPRVAVQRTIWAGPWKKVNES